MNIENIILLVLLIGQPFLGFTKTYNKCDMARTLVRYGVPVRELSDWMCLIEGESSFNTRAINPSNSDGSVDWGLFQINDRYWCKPADGRASNNSCRLPCRLLLSSNIKYSLACARYIKKVQTKLSYRNCLKKQQRKG